MYEKYLDDDTRKKLNHIALTIGPALKKLSDEELYMLETDTSTDGDILYLIIKKERDDR
jgi:hypothetical protein